MTGMSAKDRIPLLERELLRIQNELDAARDEDRKEYEVERLVVAIAWCESGKFSSRENLEPIKARLEKKLREFLHGN